MLCKENGKVKRVEQSGGQNEKWNKVGTENGRFSKSNFGEGGTKIPIYNFVPNFVPHFVPT